MSGHLHVSGVGALGSFVLWELRRRGINFTWDDTDSEFNAWSVSTGSVSPYATTDESLWANGYWFWRRTAEHYEELRPHLERTVVCYVLKNAPRSVPGKLDPYAELGLGHKLWIHPDYGYQLNVQSFVTATRDTFKEQRLSTYPTTQSRLLCRGVANADTHSLWGWTCATHVTFKRAPQPPHAPFSARPVIHMSDPKLPRNSFYLQPVAGYPGYWWAGSDIRLQRTPSREPGRASEGLKRFDETIQAVMGDWLGCSFQPAVGEGWRPVRRLRTLPLNSAAKLEEGVWVAPPLSRNGIQCGPLVAYLLVNQLFGVRRGR
jgi:hypothetical protein